MKLSRPPALLALILLLYLVLATLYAVYTPPWQAPDEPAHYNYIRYVAQNGSFPVLHMGDYPHAYLEQIKAAGFPPSMPIDSIRYEFHQPPLYYAFGAVIFTAAHGALLPLRLLSVLLGLGIVLVSFTLARRIFPLWPGLALGVAAFIAFLPQHLASVAQVGNDTLAELLFGLALVEMVTWLLEAGGSAQQAGTLPAASASSSPEAEGTARPRKRPLGPTSPLRIVALGVLLGLILITKTTAYIAVPLALGVAAWDGWHRRAPGTRVLLNILLLAVPALLFALPWYLRDLDVYGWPDFLGLRMHDLVVVGQTRTADFLMQNGWGSYLERLVGFTFKSFWGVFGWLGVFMDDRIYTGLALLCLVVAGGLFLHESRARQAESLTWGQRFALRLLAASSLLTLLGYVWYNLQFVQHQGRYFFTALIPIAVAFGLGWDEALRPRSARVLSATLLVLALLLATWGLLHHGLAKWLIALAVAAALLLALSTLVPRRFDGVLFAAPFAALPLLALYGLFGTIVPQLGR